MKRNYILLLALAFITLTISSCNKEGCTDETATNYDPKAKKDDGSCEYEDLTLKYPQITLNGDNPQSVFIFETYVELGATAVNPEDGSEAEVVINSDSLNTDETGTYGVYYTATNEYGSTTEMREVIVTVGTGNYEGDYVTESDCPNAFPIAGETAITLTGANSLVIENAFNLVGGQIELIVDGSDVTVPAQEQDLAGGIATVTLDGTGSMNSTATEIVIDYNYNNAAPVIGGQGSCTVTYVKQ